jgi:hypothetical protein
MEVRYTPLDRERAEIYALRAAIVVLLRALDESSPGTLTALKQDVAAGIDFKPSVSPAIGDPLSVRVELLRAHLTAILTEAEGQK